MSAADGVRGDVPAGALSAAEIRAIVGEIDDHTIAAIAGLGPSRAELEEALAWALGSDEALRAALRGLSGKVEAIFDLLTAEIEAEEQR